VKLYLRAEDRHPDPAPVETDDRRAIIVGTAIWVAALVVALVVTPMMTDDPFLIATCAVGVALGVAGLVYTQLRAKPVRRR
jgi:fatty acid desaturase